MLRFLGQFQADFLLTNGWIEPLLVGGYAPFFITPSVQSQAEWHSLTSFENPPRILYLFQESWSVLQDFENISNILEGALQYGVY